ncbi:hypothetical protein CQA66_07195 [Helicobacter aurati]|uniref:TonB C-terminal domain-containing protein n=1 Tax=Helicobacter aurati TaxID=137778 RepID=A0A3D8J123_9HELI|nr:energy transducer TonB [Helicobacter aurati]RDU71073.1 hypothetical protein CQA66_07195 [Helicobacter aurati]
MQTDVVYPQSNPSLWVFSGIIACILYVLMFALLMSVLFVTRKNIPINTHRAESEFIFTDNDNIELAEVLPQDESLPQDTQTTIEESKPANDSVAIESNPVPINPQPKSSQEVPRKVAQPNLADIFSFIPSETIQDKKIIEQQQQKKAQEEELARIAKEQHEKAQLLAQNAALIQQSTRALQQATRTLQDNVKQAMQVKIAIEKPTFAGSSDDKEKYNKWYDAIQEILMTEWQKNKFYYQTPTGATVRIVVSASGRLSYLYMINQSPFNEYNAAVVAFLRNMETRLFPPPPKEAVEFTININSVLRY